MIYTDEDQFGIVKIVVEENPFLNEYSRRRSELNDDAVIDVYHLITRVAGFFNEVRSEKQKSTYIVLFRKFSSECREGVLTELHRNGWTYVYLKGPYMAIAIRD